MLKAADNINASAAELRSNEFEEYYKYGDHIPKCITGNLVFIFFYSND